MVPIQGCTSRATFFQLLKLLLSDTTRSDFHLAASLKIEPFYPSKACRFRQSPIIS
jgi:hypothetical protein